MTNQLASKSKTLLDLLNQSGLIKDASQEITHKTLKDQDSLGAEQTKDLHEGVEGVLADTNAAKNPEKETVPDLPGVQDLNTSGQEGLAQRGSSVELQDGDGNPSGTPEQEANKMASDYRVKLAGILAAQRTAQEKKASAEAAQKPITGKEVFQKWASLGEKPTEAQIKEAAAALQKLASTNPVFANIREHIMMTKMAEDIEALAEAEGISPEQAAEELQAAAEANPDMMEDLESEATGEAVSDLAQAEDDTAALMDGVNTMAANASEALGQEVTPDDILNAVDEVVAQAEQMGVEPEDLIAAAVEQMQAGSEEPNEEDMAMAEQILSEAADAGITPDEVIEAVASDLGGGEGEAAPAEAEAAPEAPAEGETTEKVASQQKQAGTTRAAFVQALRHGW